MSKNKSIALIVIMAIVTAVLSVMTFVRFEIPFYKNGTTNFKSILGIIALDQDLSEGVAYDLTLKDNFDEVAEDVNDKEVIYTLKTRLKALGYDNPVVYSYRESELDNYSFHVEMRKNNNNATDIQVVARHGEVGFYDANGNEVMTADEGMKSAKFLSQKAGATYSYMVEIVFTDAGMTKLEEAINTAENGFTLSIKVGEDEVFSSSLTLDSIQNKTVYITSSTKENAQQLALQISSGGLKYEYEISDQYDVTPTLGSNAVKVILYSVLVALLVLFVALIVIYGGYGLLSSIAIYLFVLFDLILAVLVPSIILSFGGVLGMIFSLIVVIATLVNIMSKVKAEAKNGKTVKAAIKSGYSKTLFANLEIFGVLIVLSLLGIFITKGYVNNFAVMLGIGSALGAIVVILLSRLIVSVMLPLLKDKSEKFLKLEKGAE